MKTILISMIVFSATLARANDESETNAMRAEIDCLKSKLVAAENRIAKLETTASLLMATYELKVKEEARKLELESENQP